MNILENLLSLDLFFLFVVEQKKLRSILYQENYKKKRFNYCYKLYFVCVSMPLFVSYLCMWCCVCLLVCLCVYVIVCVCMCFRYVVYDWFIDWSYLEKHHILHSHTLLIYVHRIVTQGWPRYPCIMIYIRDL